jgi:hypothetical protein
MMKSRNIVWALYGEHKEEIGDFNKYLPGKPVEKKPL